MPAMLSRINIAPISTPSWCPALVRAASPIPSLESACLEKSQPTTGAAPAPPTSSTRAPRRRSGTMHIQTAMPTTRAASEPRE